MRIYVALIGAGAVLHLNPVAWAQDAEITPARAQAIKELAGKRAIAPGEFSSRELEAAAEDIFGSLPRPFTRDDSRMAAYRAVFERLGAETFQERKEAQAELSGMRPQPGTLEAWIKDAADPEVTSRAKKVLTLWNEKNKMLGASLRKDIAGIAAPLRRFPMGIAKARVLQSLDTQGDHNSIVKWSSQIGKSTLYGLPTKERHAVMREWMHPVRKRQTLSLLQRTCELRPMESDHRDIELMKEIVDWMLSPEEGLDVFEAWKVSRHWLRELPDEIAFAPLEGRLKHAWGRLFLSAAFVRRGDMEALPHLRESIAEAGFFAFLADELMHFMGPLDEAVKKQVVAETGKTWAVLIEDGLASAGKYAARAANDQVDFYAHRNSGVIFDAAPIAADETVQKALRPLAESSRDHQYVPAACLLWLGGDREPFRKLNLEEAKLEFAAIRHDVLVEMTGRMRAEFLLGEKNETRELAGSDLVKLMQVQAACLAASREGKGRAHAPAVKKQIREFANIYCKEVLPLGLNAGIRNDLTRLATWVSKPANQRTRFQELAVVALLNEARSTGDEPELVESWKPGDKPVSPDLLLNAVQILNRHPGGTADIKDILRLHWTTVCVDNCPWFFLDAVTRVDIQAGSRQEEKHRTVPHTAFNLDLEARGLEKSPDEILPQLPEAQRTLTKVALGLEVELPETMPLAEENLRWSMIELQRRGKLDEGFLQRSFDGWMGWIHKRKIAGHMPNEKELSEIAELAQLGEIRASRDFPRPEARAVAHALEAEMAMRGGEWKRAANEWRNTVPLAPGVGPGLMRSRIKQQELICRWLAGNEERDDLFAEMKDMTITFFPDYSSLLIAFLIDQGDRSRALNLFELHQERAFDPKQAPPWLQLMLAWEYAIAGKWNEAEAQTRHVVSYGSDAASIRQGAMLAAQLRDRQPAFEDYLKIRGNWRTAGPEATLTALTQFAGESPGGELKSLALWQAAGLASHLKRNDESRELCRRGAIEGAVFGRLCKIQAAALADEMRSGKLTASKMESTAIGAATDPFVKSIGLTARKGKPSKFFQQWQWFDEKGIPLSIELRRWIYDSWGWWTQLRTSDDFVISGPRRLVAESDQGHEVHQVDVRQLKSGGK